MSQTAALRCHMRSTEAQTGPRLDFYLLENLLTARSQSRFPTNGTIPDEDVNVYLAHLLGRFLTGDHNPHVKAAGAPLFGPPPRTASPARRADHYRANADHRLVYLGLFARGDGLRRNPVLHGLSPAETWQRDLAAGRACYEAAASHLRPRNGSERALAEVWLKLATHFDDYVHVLGVLASRYLGLGAHLTDNDLARLLPPDETAATRAVSALLSESAPPEAMDVLLDLWLAQTKNPDPATAARVREMADRLGVQLKTEPKSTVTKGDDFLE